MIPRVTLSLLFGLWIPLTHAVSEETKIEVQISTTVTGQQASVVLDIANQGAQIFDIRAELRSDKLNVTFMPTQKLPPGAHHKVQANIQIPAALQQGKFYAPVFISYRDRIGIKTTTVALAHFKTMADSPELSALTLKPIILDGGCSDTTAVVKNLQDNDASFALTLVTPSGIDAQPLEHIVSLPAGGTEALPFELCNELDIKLGSLPFYAISSTRYRGHFIQESATSNISIEFVSLPTRFFHNQPLVGSIALAALIILCLSWVYAVFKKSD